MTGEVEEKIREVEEKTREVEEKSREVEEKTRELEEKTREVEEKTREVEEKTREVEEKSAVVEAKNGQIQHLQNIIQTLTTQMEVERPDLFSLSIHIVLSCLQELRTGLQRRLQTKDADISRLTEELSKCQSLPQEKERQVRQ